MELILKRTWQTSKGTFGSLGTHELPYIVTLEDPWNDNQVGISCIPGNRWYSCRRVNSPNFGNTFTVENVPGRSLIRFHKGNLIKDTRGCILTAEKFDPIGKNYGVAHSAEGFREFLSLTSKVDKFELYIDNCWGIAA